MNETTTRRAGTSHESGPPARFGIRNMLHFIRAPLPFLQNMVERYGDVVPIRVATGHWLLLNHPDDIEAALVKHAADVGRDAYARILERALGKGLLTSDGDLWKRQRKLAATAFTPKRIRGYASAMSTVTERGLARWKNGDAINLHEEMSRLTMEVVADVLFGAGVGGDDVATVRSSMEVINEFFAQSPEAILRFPPWVPTRRNNAMTRAVSSVDALLFRIIEARRRGQDERDDLLQALLAATDDDGSGMDDQQLRDEMVTLFLAGHETTALALTHALYLLAKHPDAERRLHAELADVLGDRLPTQEDVARLVYTDRVIKESMRLYPPAWVSGRAVLHPMELAGRTIPVGTQLMFSQWTVHRDPRWWPSPEAFDPDRFDPELVKRRPRFAYFPFGGGPRVCIGNHFAMMEAVLMLATIATRFRVELLPFEELRFSPSVTLRPKGHGLRARLVRRDTVRADVGVSASL